MLCDLTPEEVSRIIRQSMGRSPMPHLTDPQVRQRAVRTAESQGLPERLQRELTPDQGIAALTHSLFREYRRTGSRTGYERIARGLLRQTELAAMACYLGLDYWQYLQDLMWADCERTWWIWPAHEAHAWPFDLHTAGVARCYSIILGLLGERLDAEVRRRVEQELRRRVLDVYLDPRHRGLHWRTVENNWNAVCHYGVALTAMMLEPDGDRLAQIIATTLEELEVFVDAFSADGGCSEGPSYWRYGFGHYAMLAAALHDFTDGRLDIMAGERIGRICRYPLATTVRPGLELTFADAHEGYQSPTTAALINRFHDVPELFGLCRTDDSGSLMVDSLDDLLLYDGAKHAPAELSRDVLLVDLAVVKLYSGEMAVGAKAGHNDEMHNHNDVGSFVVFRGRTRFLCDVGAPIYSARTFNEHRYESVFINSLGHSVPVIDGQGQGTGRQFAGNISVSGLNTAGPKAVRIEMAGAYDAPSLKKLTRVIELRPGGEGLNLTDAYEFDAAPRPVAEVFMTVLPVRVADDGRSATITSEADGVLLIQAECEGTFAVEELVEQSAAESRTGELLRRIRFTPARLDRRMALGFTLGLTRGSA
ncbi:MAG TPA: heparinase II/III family protein [Phycisphaerae bacterium]|nr:heparinase II/III family protein [Phycisphaerae bacterium]